jgi:hypothetical protein
VVWIWNVKAAMNTPVQFEVTSKALKVVESLLRQHPGMQAALILITSVERLDERGAVETRFEHEHFMLGYDSPDKFSQWSCVELCGRSVRVAPDALERLKGKRLTIEARDIIIVTGGKETHEFLVVAEPTATAPSAVAPRLWRDT